MADRTDTSTTAGQDAVTEAAGNAYWRMRQAAIEIAKAGGAEIHERPPFRGSISVYQYAEPLAGIRAAQTLAGTAARIRREYAEAARGEGITWERIGQALGLDQGDDAKTGYDLAIAAYEFFTGRPDLWREANFGYRCVSCQEYITDRGPYESHPDDNERGHSDGCARFTAEVAAWQARHDEEWGK